MTNLLTREPLRVRTTAEILYWRPDHPQLLQSYLWQDDDLIPGLPKLRGFLKFWRSKLEGKLHRVEYAWYPIDRSANFHRADVLLRLH